MTRQTDLKDAPSLLITSFRQFTKLMQDELALAKAELSRNLSRAGVGLALIGAGAILALTALDVLAGALVAYLATTQMSAGTAALLVGGACLAGGIVLALAGRARLRANALVPDQTLNSVTEDYKTMKEAPDAE